MPDTTSLDTVLAGVQAAGDKYETLGVARTATEGEIRIAFRRLALLYHPDRQPEEHRATAHLIFREMAGAYRVLADAEERILYDRALRSGEDYRESTDATEGISLRDVLAGILQYEHIFSEGRLAAVDTQLRDAVVPALIDDLSEQVIAVYRMLSAPTGASMQGNYKVGAVVITSIRVLLPFSYQWEENQGGQKVRYTGWAMPSFPLPLVTRIVIEQHGCVKPETVIRIETDGTKTEVKPQESDLAKVLIIARLWAVPLEARVVGDPRDEFRRAMFGPSVKAALACIALLAVSAVVGIFAGGFLDNPAWILVAGAESGVWHVLFLLCAVLTARRLSRWVDTHRRMSLSSLLPAESQNSNHSEQKASVATA